MSTILIKSFDQLIEVIEKDIDTQKVSLIAVAGLGCSGKTTLCRNLCRYFQEESLHLECDLFAKYDTVHRKERIRHALESGDSRQIEEEENPQNWYEWDDFKEALDTLKVGTCYKIKNGWNQKTGKKDIEKSFDARVEGNHIIFIDCIYLLHPLVKNWFDRVIFVKSPIEITYERAKKRDEHRSDLEYLAYKQGLVQKYDLPYFEKYVGNADWIYDVLEIKEEK